MLATPGADVERFIGYLKRSFWVPFVASIRRAGLKPDKHANAGSRGGCGRSRTRGCTRRQRDSGEAARHRGAEAVASGDALCRALDPIALRATTAAQSHRWLPASAQHLRGAVRGGAAISTLQHDRIKVLAAELRLIALPDIYGAIAQAAAKRKDTSYADFLEEVLRAERDARRVRAR